MVKPATLDGYSDQYTVDCERVLVTLLRGLGPWKDSVYLVGGLTPRYLVAARPPAVPAHAGTLDVDIVIDLQILADTEAYHTLEDNLRKMGFERAENEKQQKLSWRWQTRTEHGALMVLELLGGNGVATEKIKHANLVSFSCLKCFAFDQRFERKDAHDLIYCIEHATESIDTVAEVFRKERSGKHGAVIEASLAILRSRFAGDDKTEGHRKDGPVSVAKFELGESDEPEQREARALRQRQASDVIEQLLTRLG